MRVCMSLKSRELIIEETSVQKIKEEIEMALSDIDWVLWAIFDVFEMKIDVEFDDTEEDFELPVLIRTVQESWKFQVLGIS